MVAFGQPALAYINLIIRGQSTLTAVISATLSLLGLKCVENVLKMCQISHVNMHIVYTLLDVSGMCQKCVREMYDINVYRMCNNCGDMIM